MLPADLGCAVGLSVGLAEREAVHGEAARVVRIGSAIGEAAKLAEVRARSIVVDRNGGQREIALPAVQKANAFVR